MSNGRLEVLTAVMKKIQVFRNIKPRRVANSILPITNGIYFVLTPRKLNEFSSLLSEIKHTLAQPTEQLIYRIPLLWSF
jgi:hypothetical protein